MFKLYFFISNSGEVFFVPAQQNVTTKTEVEIDIEEPKLITDIEFNAFNPVVLERLTSNKDLNELNEDFLDDFFFTDPGNVKFDEEWLNNFMEPTPSLEIPYKNENFDIMMNSFSKNNDVITDMSHQHPNSENIQEILNANASDFFVDNNLTC